MILYYFGLCRASISRKMNAKKLEIRARGGRQELEVAAHWLRTPIKVFHTGDLRYPANSWICYGQSFENYQSRCIMLHWKHGNHFEFVSTLK